MKWFSTCSKIVANVSNAMAYKMLSLLNFHPFLEEPGPNLERPELIVLKVNNAIDFGPKQNSSRLLQSCSNQEPETKLSVWL